jgi:tRNA-specific 2-thiouridylase
MIAGKRLDCARSGANDRGGVVVGMSGGVDSSTAALMLRERGYRVVGVTLRFFRGAAREVNERACCSERSLRRARDLCRRSGIEHHVVDVEDEFGKAVIGDFLREYRRGRTPNPCIRCNEKVKFPALARVADRLGFEKIATGHYARLRRDSRGRIFLARALDRERDQSYFLYRVAVSLLRRTVLPLGDMGKRDVRQRAARSGYGAPEGAGSQDICFLPAADLHRFLAAHLAPQEGEIVDSQGNVLGTHKGISFYTVGQRRGFGISGAVPLYVKRIDAPAGRIVLAPEEELYSRTAVCRNVKLRSFAFDGGYRAKIRYRHRPADVEAVRRTRGALIVRFTAAQRALTPGQSLVLYRGDVVVGGGIIDRVEEAR